MPGRRRGNGPTPPQERLATLAPALRAAARQHGTPLYVLDAEALDTAAEAVRTAFPDPWLRAYSLKANDLPAVVARIVAHGFGANVVSRGEWALARRAGVVNAAITLEGIGKTDADLRAAVRAAAVEPLRWVSVESAEEAASLHRLLRSAGHPEVRIDTLVRMNPAVDPETHAGMATGSQTSKFGVTADEVGAVMDAGGGVDGPLRWRGLHIHVGSQLGAVDAWRDGVRRALALVALLRGSLPDFDTLDVGGGMPAARWRPAGAVAHGSPAVPTPERFAAELPGLLSAIPADRRPRRLAVEPGRVVVSGSGWLVARVLHVRERIGPPSPPPVDRSGAHGLAVVPLGSTSDDRTRRLVVIDAGMTELIRPALYGVEHAIVALTSMGRLPSAGTATRPTRVDGPICETTDTFGEHALPRLRRGDLVAIADAGAYASSMRSAYNGRPRPTEVFVEADGSLVVARRRGTQASLA